MIDMPKQTEALKLALEALQTAHLAVECDMLADEIQQAISALREALTSVPDWASEAIEQPAPMIRGDIRDGLVDDEPAQQEPVAWISVKDALPKAVRGVSYNASLTDVVLVRHSDRPDYPITAHAVVGEGLGAGIAIPTEGASEHPEIAWYSASSNLNNPFDLKNDDYDRYLPKVFGSKITHWKPIDTSPPAQRTWVGLTEEEVLQIRENLQAMEGISLLDSLTKAIEAKLKEKNA